MKRNGILNSEISSTLSFLGHTDSICISDCGLPVPNGVKRIDLALCFGKPSFMEVLKEISKEMKIEKIILAKEITKQNNKQYLNIIRFFENEYSDDIPEIVYVSHDDFKKQLINSKAIIRTGENTPYSNIILQSGCIFSNK